MTSAFSGRSRRFGLPRLSLDFWRPYRTSGAPVTPATPIIFDQDLCADCDDVASIAVIARFAAQGLCTVIAGVTSSSDPYAAPCLNAMFNYAGLTSVPIGAFQGSTTPSVGSFTAGIVADFTGSNVTRSSYSSAVTVLRTALAAASNGTVIYYCAGFLDNLSALLQSPGDGISALTGLQLVTAKVQKVVIMGGDYPSGTEYNLVQSPAAASYVAANCPVPMLWNGAAVGNTISVGPSTALAYSNVYRRAYALMAVSTRPAWDAINSMLAVLGVTSDFNTPGVNGTNTVNSGTGANTWTSTTGLSTYLGKVSSDATIQGIVQGHIDAAPNVNPVSVPAWVQSGAVLDLDFVNDRYYGGFLTTLMSCVRAAYGPDSLARAVDASGSFNTYAANILRRNSAGLLVEQAATNVALWNRDLTNAAWTASNVTVAKNQTGADGAANSASSLTASAGLGTVLQAVTLASSTRVQSAWIKRLTGSGVVNMTTDGGTTWNPVTFTASWTRVQFSQATVTNPSFGFQIVTSGDAVAVDFVQNETSIGGKASSPILTNGTAVTRPQDTVQNLGPWNTNARLAQGSVFMQTNSLNMGTFAIMLGIGATTTQLFGTGSATTQVRGYMNNVQLNATIGGAGNLNTGRVKMAHAFDGTGHSIVANNGTVASDANVFVANQFFVVQANGYIERISILPTKLSNAALAALTV